MEQGKQNIFKAKLLRRDEIASKTFLLEFAVSGSSFSFQAGQYVWLKVNTLLYPDSRGERRAFSIASSPKKDTITIILRGLTSGYKKTLLNLPLGSSVELIGPFGSFISRLPSRGQKTIFVAGGVGVAPFLSVIHHSQEVKDGQNIHLIYSEYAKNRLIPEVLELYEEAKQSKFLKISINIGMLKEAFIKQNTASLQDAFWYFAGPQGMIDELVPSLLSSGVSEDHMTFEEHYPYIRFERSKNLLENILATQTDAYKFATDASLIHTIITDVNGIILYANDAASRITGFCNSEILGHTPRLWGGLMDQVFYKELWERKKIERKPFTAKVTNRRKTGEQYIAELVIAPILGASGDLLGFIANEKDITEAEEGTQIKARDEAILGGMAEGLVVVDKDMRTIFINKAAEYATGWSNKKVLGKIWPEVIDLSTEDGKKVPPDQYPLLSALHNKKITTSTVADTSVATYVYTRKNKTKFPVQISVSPIVIGKEIIGAIALFRDITQDRNIYKAKTEFVSLSSHQLRTPLSIIKWYAEILLDKETGKLNKKQEEYLQEIYKSNQRMIELISALLNTARMEMGTFVLRSEPVDLVGLAHEIVKGFRPQIDQKKLRFKENYADDLPKIYADPKFLRIVLENILSNAVKYTPNSGEVRLDLRFARRGETIGGKKIDQDSIAIVASDTGLGMPRTQQDKIFSRFFRADNVREKNPEGTGLGLYIVKTIIDKTDGKIWFESEENKGTTFYITLPLAENLKK